MIKVLISLLLLGLNEIAFADVSTNVVGFSQQAGIIAGTAQACGVDTTLFQSRIYEAFPRMAKGNTDLAYAMGVYQSSAQRAKSAQNTQHTMDCNQVAQDFRNLPILRDDYQNSVLSKLVSTTPTPVTITPSVPPVPQLPIQQQVPSPPAPAAAAPTPPPSPPPAPTTSLPGVPNVAVVASPLPTQ